MNQHTVSVIIPVYNAANYLRESIESVLCQTYSDLEIIIVNDGSTDNSLEIAESYQNDSRVKIISSKNKGAATARNIGIRNSNGAYFQFLDADDILPSNKIEEQMKVLDENSKYLKIGGVAFCSWTSFDENIRIKSCDERICHTYEHPIDILVDFMKYGTMLALHCYLIPRRVMEIAGLWDESLSLNDDGEWFARIISVSEILVYYGGIEVCYRDTPNSLSKSKLIQAMNSEIWGYIHHAEIARRSGRSETNSIIFKFLSGKLSFYYPYYKEYRLIGEMYLKSKMPDMEFSYPHLPFKVWMYYWAARLGLFKKHLPF